MARFMSENPAYEDYDIGAFTYGSPKVQSWRGGGKLKIGRFCSIAAAVLIALGGEHHVDWVTTYPFPALFPDAKRYPGHPTTKGDVIIGNDVWIGYGATILSGVTIGNGAVIGARSMIASDVGAYQIAVGNPARPIRLRFAESEVASLQRIAWWDWPLEEIALAYPLLLAGNVAAFIARYGKEE